MLFAIDEEHQEVAIAALRWLCFSAEVLTIRELAEASVFSAFVKAPSKGSPFEVSFDSNERIEDPFDVLIILSGLVTTREYELYFNEGSSVVQNSESNQPRTTAKNFEILLAHFSVKEYLVSGRLRDQVQPFALDEDLAHERMATTCIYYVLFSQPCLEYPPNDDLQVMLYDRSSSSKYGKEYPLFRYAARNWRIHTWSVEDQTQLSDRILSLFSAELPIQWGLFFRNLSFVDKNNARTLTSLYLLSTLGLYQPVKKLLDIEKSIFSPEGFYGSALQTASGYGNESIVQLLIDHGAGVNLKVGQYGCALQAASHHGYESIVQLLIDHGADVNLEGGVHGCALIAASQRGYGSIVQLLLDYGANVNLIGGKYGSAFQGALRHDDLAIAQTLLDYGADVNCEGGCYGTALQAASTRGSLEIVQFLLDHGADVEISGGGRYGTPIQAALRENHVEISVMLLEHGAILALEDYIFKYRAAEIALVEKDWKRLVDIILND